MHEGIVTELPPHKKSVCNHFSYTKGQDPKSYCHRVRRIVISVSYPTRLDLHCMTIIVLTRGHFSNLPRCSVEDVSSLTHLNFIVFEFCVIHFSYEHPFTASGGDSGASPAVTGSLTDQRAQCEHVLFLSIKHRLPPAPSSLTSALLLVLSPAICPDFASTSVRMSKMASPIDVDGLWCCSGAGVGIGSITVRVKAMPPSLLTPSSLRVTSPDLTHSSVRPQGSHGPRPTRKKNRVSLFSLLSLSFFLRHYFDSSTCSLAICSSVLFNQRLKDNRSQQLSFAFLPFALLYFSFFSFLFPSDLYEQDPPLCSANSELLLFSWSVSLLFFLT